MPRFPPFPPNPEDIEERLLGILRPPLPPWLLSKIIGAREEEPGRRRRLPAMVGTKFFPPYEITWKESKSGRGQLKVKRYEKTLGTVSYLTPYERGTLVSLLMEIIRGR